MLRESGDPIAQEYSLSDYDRAKINGEINSIYGSIEEQGLGLPAEQRSSILHSLDGLFQEYSPEAIWDVFTYRGRENKYKNGEGGIHQGYKRPDAYNLQEHLVNEGEVPGGVGAFMTFGIAEPAYREILEDDFNALRSIEKPHAALFGSMTHHSADEFDDFAKSINPLSVNTVVDIAPYGMAKARPSIQRVQGDVTELPLKTESQDIVFTNFLLPFLLQEGDTFTKGASIMKMLRESYRCLRHEGRLVMIEKDVVNLDNTIGRSNFVAHMLLASLKNVGFSGYKAMYSRHYIDHRAKSEGNQSKIREATRSLVDPVTLKKVGIANFAFCIKGKKK